MSNKTIDILLATYNGERYLDKQLESLFSQTVQDFTILIRDDCSSDNTLKILSDYQSKYSNKIQIINDKLGNLGSSKSFMQLLEHSHNKYIMFCDQDDVWAKNKIEVTLAKIHELENNYNTNTPLLVFTDMQVVDNKLNVLNDSFWKLQKLNPDISSQWKKLLAQNVITGCTIMINQATKNILLPYTFDEMQHDHWIGINVAKYGHIEYLKMPTLLYRQHDNNVEGAHHFGWNYIIQKLKAISLTLKKLNKSAKIFNEVSFLTLLRYKFQINIERLIK